MDYVLQRSDGKYVTINSDNRFHRYRKYIYKKSLQLGIDLKAAAFLWTMDTNQRGYALELKRFSDYVSALQEKGEVYMKCYIFR